MQLQLISSPICPYAQRAVIALRHKQVDFDLVPVDLANPPPWFREVSPLGKVPVLRVDGTTSLFESAAINEFLDEVTAPRLLPSDPIDRARVRAWIAHAGTLQGLWAKVMFAHDEPSLERATKELFDGIDPLEASLSPGPLFRGASLCLADTAFAPLFMRIELLHGWRPFPRWSDYPKTRAWARTLLDHPAVAGSVGPGFADAVKGVLRKRGAVLAPSG